MFLDVEGWRRENDDILAVCRAKDKRTVGDRTILVQKGDCTAVERTIGI